VGGILLETLLVNTRVDLVVEEDEYRGTYKTRVEDKLDKGIVVGMPMSQGTLIPLRPGTPVLLNYTDALASYSCHCKVLSRTKGTVPLLLLENPTKIDKVQRRSFVRVDTKLQIDFCHYIKDDPNPEYLTGTVLDISGGGARLISDSKAIKNDVVRAIIHFPKEKMEIKCNVAWVYSEERNGKEKFFIGIEYRDIAERLQDRIIKYVFDRQRELILKGVLE